MRSLPTLGGPHSHATSVAPTVPGPARKWTATAVTATEVTPMSARTAAARRSFEESLGSSSTTLRPCPSARASRFYTPTTRTQCQRRRTTRTTSAWRRSTCIARSLLPWVMLTTCNPVRPAWCLPCSTPLVRPWRTHYGVLVRCCRGWCWLALCYVPVCTCVVLVTRMR